MSTRSARLIRPILLCLIVNSCCAYQPIGRWGQRTAVTNNGLFIYGGKSDQFNSYSYTSAPNVNDLLFLPLGNSFSSSSPPWQLLSDSSLQAGPAVSWHTISAINDSCLLLFGGLPDPNSATVLSNLADSAYLLNLQDGNMPNWISMPQSWASEPIRRIRHSSTLSNSGLLFIVGGEKADGSANTFPENYIFDPNIASFMQLSYASGPSDIYDHASITLNDGRLLVLGGYYQPQNNLVPFTNIWSLDTRTRPSNWSLLLTSNATLPSPRRAFAATLLVNDKVLIHGGSDAALQQNYADGWILDTSSDPMTWKNIGSLTQLGARREHFAVPVNSGHQVLFGFGYGDSGPMSPTLYVYDIDKDAFVTTFTPSPPTSSNSSSQTYPQHTSFAHHKPSTTRSGGSPTGVGLNGEPDSHSGSKRPRNIALGTFSGIAVVVATLIALYYARRCRQQRRRNGYFVSLGEDDESHRSHPIPAVVMVDQGYIAERRSAFGLFKSLRLPGSPGNGRNIERALPIRRDMLADEDAYDDRGWYHLKPTRDAERSSWSFRSIVSNHLRSREPSTTDLSVNIHRQEKSDPFNTFTEDVRLLRRRSPSYLDQNSVSNMSSRLFYRDPFVDPAQNVHGGRKWVDGTSASVAKSETPPQHDTFLLSQVTVLDPIRGQGSQLLPNNDSLGVSTEQTEALSVPTDTDVNLTLSYTTSLINANPGLATPMSRSDSWWKRFTRSTFLDRKLSSMSRKSPSMDVKEYNSLMPIEEQRDSLALKSVTRRSVEIVENQVKSRSASNIYEGPHERSLSSFRTANTEGIEKIGGVMDVFFQRGRMRSNRSSSSSIRGLNIGKKRSGSMTDDALTSEELTQSPTQLWTDDDYFTDPNRVNTAFGLSPSTGTTRLDLASPGSTASSGGLVAARVQAYERRLSLDNDTNRPYGREQLDITTMKYKLAPRQSLFIANPDAYDGP